MAKTTKSTGPKKMTRKTDAEFAAEVERKREWVRSVVKQARRIAWATDMTNDELDRLAEGLRNGFPGDRTQAVAPTPPPPAVMPVPDDIMRDLRAPAPATAMSADTQIARLKAELARLEGKAQS